jgi:hypothetical protein
VVAEEVVAGLAPGVPGALGIGLGADGRVELEDAPAPVE